MSTTLGYLVGQAGEFSGVRVAIPETGLIIGRDPSQVDVVFRHTMVSRRHAQIAPDKKGRLYLIDLESRNGTCVNGRKITAPVPLSVGDKVDFGSDGKVVFVFESAATPSVTGILNQIFGENVASVDWKVGDTILDTYEVLGVLGEGGFGRVYRVRHKSWNVDLAVKSPRPKLFSDERAVADFVREAETWVNLNLHPNIVQCFYVRTIGGIPRIFAEFVPGGSLHNWIEKGKLTRLDQILDVAIQFAWGLHAAHEQGLVHQDVKPLNVLMMPDGTAKVSDFGLARARRVVGEKIVTGRDNMVTMAGMFTQAYCSPEQVQGHRLSRKTDMWSFAVSLLEMFVGKLTWMYGFQAGKVLEKYQGFFGPKFAVKMPKQLAKLLARCFRLKPEERPKDMREVAAEMQEVYRETVGTKHPRPEPRDVEHLADSLNNRAVSLLDLGREEDGVSLLNKALRIEPTHIETIYNRGLLQWRSGEITDQLLLANLTDAGKEIAANERWRAHLLLGLVHLERGDRGNAQDKLRVAQESGENIAELCERLDMLAEFGNEDGCIRNIEAHNKGVTDVAFLPNGRHFLSASYDKTLRLWDFATGKCVHSFEGHTSGVCAVAVSPDGLRAVSGSGGTDASIRIWNLATGECVRVLCDNVIDVNALAFLPNGHMCVSGGYDKVVRLWDLRTGCCLRILEGHSEQVESVAVSPDGRFVLSGSGDRTLRLWELESGRCVRVIDTCPKEDGTNIRGDFWVSSVAISPNGRWGLAACGDSIVRLWDLTTGKCLREFKGHTSLVFSIIFSQDGRQFLSGGDTTVRVWDLATNRCIRTFEGHQSGVKAVAISPDGCFGLSGGHDTTLRVWGLPTCRAPSPFRLCRPRYTAAHGIAAKKFAALMKQAHVAMGQRRWQEAAVAIRAARECDGYKFAKEALDAWSSIGRFNVRKTLAGGWCVRVLEGHTDSVRCVGLTLTAQWSFSAGWDGSVRFWEVETGRCVRTSESSYARIQSGCALLSKDNRCVFFVSSVGASRHHRFSLWNMEEGKCAHMIERDMRAACSLSLSPDCHWVLVGQMEQIDLLELPTGNCVRSLKGHKGQVVCIVPSADWRVCLTGSWDNTIRLWDLATGQVMRKFDGHLNWVHSVALSNCRRWALSGSRDKTVRLWETNTGKCVQVLEGHTNEVKSVAMSADGRWGVSGSSDKTVRLWDLAAGCCRRIFEGHTGGVNAVALSKDARWILSGSDDRSVRLWEVDWEYEFPDLVDWNEGARPCLETFLTLRCRLAGDGLSRGGKPSWTEEDFQELLTDLQNCGYGWLRSEGVRHELEKMAANWSSPPLPIPK